jgi:non-ribosomal peptide synthase protein (TIGR01720 family)
MDDSTNLSGFEIAVIGMSGRFPGARSVNEFWQNLCDGRESITFFSDEELTRAGIPEATLRQEQYVKATALLDDVELFDADFFGISPREAETMDPQHRLFLECAWTALEDAGLNPAAYPGSIGVYGGASINTYLLNNLLAREPGSGIGALPTLFGNGGDYLTTRVSYKLDLKGPSVNVQTSCSTSLVAVHLACQALVGGECDVALAGGASVSVPQVAGYVYQEQGIYSPDGHCRAFDEDAQGTVGGRGVALVVLKRLADALADGDSIRAVIKGTAINNDGSDKIGYAAPSVEGQASVITDALAAAELDPGDIGYVEAHGTGTPLGDPIEIAALTQAYRKKTGRKGFCLIGSVKTNIGHLDAAAGVTGLIKTTLALQHRVLPPSLNFKRPNPEIGFGDSPFVVNDRLTRWEQAGPLRAAVSSFGIGGTNAHAVLEEAPPVAPADPAAPHQLFVLSARTAPALEEASKNLLGHLAQHGDLDPGDVAYTLQTGRKEFDWRRMFVCSDLEQARQTLGKPESAGTQSRLQPSLKRKIAFMFPGQGAQYPGMGRELYRLHTVFREEVDRCAEILQPHLGLDLRELLFAPAEDETAESRLRQTSMAQPALFVIEFALARQWIGWGINPEAMIGHSIGEYVAACLSGVLKLEDALALVAKRGQLIQEMAPGSMLAIPLPEAEITEFLNDNLSLAAVNERSACVLSGPDEAVNALELILQERGLAGVRLRTSHAFHSVMMEPMLDAFRACLTEIELRPPRIPYLSNVTGGWITAEEATDPQYWANHIRQTVRFAAGLEELLGQPDGLLLEVGPGSTLTSMARRMQRETGNADGMMDESRAAVVASMANAKRDQQVAAASLYTALGEIWLSGASIDWPAVHAPARRRKVALPTYPFERERFWIDARSAPGPDAGGADLRKQEDIADWFHVASWKRAAPLAPLPGAIDRGAWLVCGDGGAEEEIIVRSLEEHGLTVSIVHRADCFASHGDGRYDLNPCEPGDYDALVRALLAEQRFPGRIVHLWGGRSAPGDSAEEGLSERDLAFYSPLFLAQSIGRLQPDERVELTLATRYVHEVLTGDPPPRPQRATALGLCTAIPQELANVSCRSVELEATEDQELLARQAGMLARELLSPPGEAIVAYRGAHRWQRTYAPIRVEEHGLDAGRLRAGGVFLVVGGLGAIGLDVADCLGRATRGKIVLTGRSELPPRQQWSELIQQENEWSQCIRKVLALEETGAEVAYFIADATDPGQMRAALQEAEERFGPVHGAVFAAGDQKSMAMLLDSGRSECEAHLRVKRRGLQVLEELLQDRELDFCFVHSSLASALGAIGMVGYVAAHHYLDAFVARHNRLSNQLWTSVNWDHWLTWKEPDLELSSQESSWFMTPEEGASAFLRVIRTAPAPQLLVSTGNLDLRLRKWATGAAGQAAEAPQAEQDREQQAGHERRNIATEYVPPRTPAEQALAKVWGEVLGIREVGAKDSFFELGGDSVLGLQVVAKAAQAGLRITPAQIFEHPTVESLAEVAASAAGPRADQGRASGELPLTPIQKWFFDLRLDRPDHFNLPAVIELDRSVGPATLEAALAGIVEHHDALRLRFKPDPDGSVRQFYDPSAAPPEVSDVDLSELPVQERDDAMRRRASQLQTQLHLEAGPLMRCARFDFGPDQPARFLWIVHHLLVDVVSWRVLAEDLTTALEQIQNGRQVTFPAKTSSFQKWATGLLEVARSDRLRDELGHWQALSRTAVAMLPLDSSEGSNDYGSARACSGTLDEPETQALVQQLPAGHDARVEEVLLAALARAFGRWTRSPALLVDLEGHGREDVVEGLDLSRTVGWFTSIYPALLTVDSSAEPAHALAAIKEQYRRIPRRGIGFGLARYLADDPQISTLMTALPSPELNFLYLGQFDDASRPAALRLMQPSAGLPCSVDNPRQYLIEIVALVSNGRLRIDFTYSVNRHSRDTVEGWLEDYLAELRNFAEECSGTDPGRLTPSRFPSAKVSQRDLDTLLGQLGAGGGEGDK